MERHFSTGHGFSTLPFLEDRSVVRNGSSRCVTRVPSTTLGIRSDWRAFSRSSHASQGRHVARAPTPMLGWSVLFFSVGGEGKLSTFRVKLKSVHGARLRVRCEGTSRRSRARQVRLINSCHHSCSSVIAGTVCSRYVGSAMIRNMPFLQKGLPPHNCMCSHLLFTSTFASIHTA